MTKCDKENKIQCPTCKMDYSPEHLGERCMRCNSVLMPSGCEICSKDCIVKDCDKNE